MQPSVLIADEVSKLSTDQGCQYLAPRIPLLFCDLLVFVAVGLRRKKNIHTRRVFQSDGAKEPASDFRLHPILVATACSSTRNSMYYYLEDIRIECCSRLGSTHAIHGYPHDHTTPAMASGS